MRKNFGKQSWLYPMPVLIIATYDTSYNPDIMNAAWGGMADTNQISICLSGTHQTTENILAMKDFTVSIGTKEYLTSCDYVGLVSLKRDKDKIKKSLFTLDKAPNVNAPIINELPMALECRLVSYNEQSGLLIADIINVSASDAILTDGKIDPLKLHPIAYDPVNNNYLEISQIAGQAFQAGLKLR